MDYGARLAAAVQALDAARRERDELIREAATEGGMSVRRIAAATGLSWARVQQIVAAGRTRT